MFRNISVAAVSLAVFLAFASAVPAIADGGLDIYTVNMYFQKQHFGNQPACAPYEMVIAVEGTGISEIEVLAPSQISYQMTEDWSGDYYVARMSFETQQDMYDAFGLGNYFFDFNGGEDYLLVGFNVDWPLDVPQIIYPSNWQTNVELDPVFQWTSYSGMADNLWGHLFGGPPWDNFYVDGFSVAPSITEYQFPDDLQAEQDYSFSMTASNLTPDTRWTTFGRQVQVYYGSHYGNMVQFDTKEPPDLAIEQIEISKNTAYIAGVLDDDPYEFSIEVIGEGITSVTVTCPNDIDHDLERWWINGWGFDLEYATQAERDADWLSGNYTFTFNAGTDSEDTVTVPFNVTTPGARPIITNPADGATGIGRSPLYEWELDGDGTGSLIAVSVEQALNEYDFDDIAEEFPLPIEQTTWRGPHLRPETGYRFLAATVNIEGGGFHERETDGGVPFTYIGVALQEDEVEFSTADVLPPAIEEITLLKTIIRVGDDPEDIEYLVEIEVCGEGIESASVQLDGGATVYHLVNEWDDEWGLEEEYESLQARDAAWPAGNYTFTFNAGEANEDTVTLPHTVSTPAAYPTVTYPQNGATGVSLNPLYEWTLTGDGTGSVIAVFLEQNLGDDEWDDIDEDVPLPIETRTWQSEALSTNSLYAFLVCVANVQGGEFYQETTDGGLPFLYIGVALQEDEIEFSTIETAPPAIEEILILKNTRYTGGVLEDTPYRFEVEVSGAGINSIIMRDPNGIDHDLQPWDSGEWGLEYEYASEAARDAAWPAGNYTFTFNAGEANEDTVTLPHTIATPAAYPTVTHPMHGAQSIGKNPVYEWTLTGDGTGSVIAVFLEQNYGEYWDDIDEEVPLPIETTTWQSTEDLSPDSDYAFLVSVANVQGGEFQQMTTDGGQPFTYIGVSLQEDEVEFSTAPMPVVDNILLVTMLRHVDGQPAAMPARAMRMTDGIYTNVTVTTPNDEEVQLQQVDDEYWALVEDFASLADLYNKYPAGNYLFTFNDGFDTAWVFWGVAIPGEFPEILEPEHNQQNVNLTPTFHWTEVGGHLQAAFIKDAETEEELQVVFPMDIGLLMWQPEPLEQFTEYTFEIGVGLSTPVWGSYPMWTAEGEYFEFRAVAANSNSINFTTGGWHIPGDVSGDCQVDNVDLIFVRNRLGAQLPGTDEWLADVNEDGVIDLLDLVSVRNRLGTGCPE